MRVRRKHNGMKRNEEIGLFTLPSIFIDKSDALWFFKSAFRQSHQNSHASCRTHYIYALAYYPEIVIHHRCSDGRLFTSRELE